MREKILAESPTMLFSREFENLHDDGFEGSLDEQRIFNEIFLGNDVIGKKRIIVSEATAIHCEYIKQSDMSLCSNSGKSSLTSQDDYTKEEFARKHPLECSNEVELSVGYLPDVKPESGISQEDSGSACQSLMYRVVESSGKGVTSSSYILQPLVYSDRGCETSDRGCLKNGASCLDQNDQGEAAKRAVTSPISQESYASRLLVNDPPVSKLVTIRPTKTKWKDSCFLKLDEEEFAMPKDLKNDPRPLLRYHINRLLRASGWEIGRRKRNSKYNGIGEYVYKSPEGRPIREFHRAWWMCGETLFSDADIIMQTSDGMQWSDIAELWTDLSSAVKEIDDKLNILENTYDMAHLWDLLDPFANVVFIEKTIRLLKEGITVKAKRSLVSPSHSGSPGKLQKISRSDRSHLNPKPQQDCGYNGISQIGVRLFDVPNNSGASQLCGGPESLILHPDCSTSTPCFDQAKNEEGGFDHIRQNHKKSRKISEMKLTENHFGERCHYTVGEKSRSGRRSKKSKACRLQDDDLLISTIIKTKTCGATNKGSMSKSKPTRRRKTPKGSCKLLPRSLKKGAKHIKEGNWYAIGSRTVLSWLIHCGVVSLNEAIQYRDLKDDAVIKSGLVTRDGIFCKCCSKVLSLSEFNIHGGFRSIHPSMNLFMESGKPFTLCQLEAWSAEYKARKVAPQIDQVDEIDQNDDSCGRCGDVGELICCDNCPSAFHQACLFEQELPEGNWYCPQCRCQICGDVVDDKETLQHGVVKCSQCEQKYHETCMQREVMEVEASNTWFCGGTCQKVYTALQSRTGLKNLISDGFSWTLLRCIPCDEKVHSSQSLVALKAECNSKLAVAITIMEECFLPMVDMKTGIDMMPQVMYNWGSQFARLNYNGFYTAVLEKDDVVLSVASIRIHGVAVAELPLVATCSKNRRQGLCRRLINSIEEMLKALKVEKLVVSAIPNLVETWTIGFGFQPLDEDERKSLSKINLMVFPGAVWLKKPLYESCTLDGKSEQGQLPIHEDVTEDHVLNQSLYSTEQGQPPIHEDNIETGICCDDPKNLQYCNGHHNFPIPQDPKPSCNHSPVQETSGMTRNICHELDNAVPNDFLPSQPSKHDEAVIPSSVKEAGLQDSEDVKSGERQNSVCFLDEFPESYSHVVQDCGILHGPVPEVSSEELVCRTEPEEMHIERRITLNSCKTNAIESVGE